jgi:UPF0755 protein
LRLKKGLLFLAVIFVILMIVSAALVTDLWLYANRASSENTDTVVIQVNAGQPFKITTDNLYTQRLIHSPFRFNLIARLKGYDKKLQAGEYLISGSMSPLNILEKLKKGEVRLYKLTIPEGFNIYQIAELIEKAGFANKVDFIKAAENAVHARQKLVQADTFEGYLFPDTYFFPKNISVQKIITTMVDRFWSVFKPEWKKQAQAYGFTVHQVVTLASIIEKETGAPFERPIISSVFHNRLKKKMRLESDPTVIYGIQDFDGNLTRKHLATLTPYNTYRIKGLPAGPIANPGQASLEAALFPTHTPYIYFVSKKDRTHQFSTNLKDHNKAVRKFQLRR